jgi:hypothetical protein
MAEEFQFAEQECRILWSRVCTCRLEVNCGRAEAVSGRLFTGITQVRSKFRSYGNSAGKSYNGAVSLVIRIVLWCPLPRALLLNCYTLINHHINCAVQSLY